MLWGGIFFFHFSVNDGNDACEECSSGRALPGVEAPALYVLIVESEALLKPVAEPYGSEDVTTTRDLSWS